jgi:phospholipid/cholesterol/gamma-HCH transport system substrate-binding protein
MSEDADAPVTRRRAVSRPLLGLVTLIVVCGVAAVVFSGLARKLLAAHGQHLSAVFQNTQLLSSGSPVRVNGVDVGMVTGARLDPGGRSTTVQMEISDGAALPIYADATAQLVWRTVLGANYAIELARGTPAAGVLDTAVIPLSHTRGQVELDQVLAALQGAQRQGLRTMVAELPRALADRTAPAAALGTLARVSPALARGLGAAQGQHDGDLRRLVTNVADMMRALNTPVPTLTDVVSGGAATVQTTAGRALDIQRTLALAARVLPDVRLTARRLDATLGLADPVLAHLRPVAPAVAPTVAVLLPTVSSANTLLHRARPLLRSLRPAAAALAGAARPGRQLLDQLAPSHDRLANRILPDLAKPYGQTQRPTYEMIGPTLAALDAAAASFDSVSHFVTLTAGGGERSLDTLPCQTYFVDPTAQQLLQCENATAILQGLLGYKPIPQGAHR